MHVPWNKPIWKIPYNYMYRGTDISIYCSPFKVGLIKINRNQKRREFNFFFQSELWSLIFEWFLFQPANTTLKDYGRLQKDGELKVKNHTDNKIRIRWVSLCNLYLTSLLNQVLLSVIGCKIMCSKEFSCICKESHFQIDKFNLPSKIFGGVAKNILMNYSKTLL